MRINIKLFYFVFIGNSFFSQMSISGGMSILNGVGTGYSPFGFHASLELPRSSDLTFYVRAAAFLPSSSKDSNLYANMIAIDQTTVPYTLSVGYKNRSTTLHFEGGTRSYLLNDYDNGFGLYGGSVFGFGINTTRLKYDTYDFTNMYAWEGKYNPSNGVESKGSIYYLALGIQGGLKYTIPIKGTIYFDISGIYSLLNIATNSVGSDSPTYSRLNFLFNLGYRRDLY